MDPLGLAHLALAAGLLGFGTLWGWQALRPAPERLPGVPRVLALILLLLAVGGMVAAVLLGPRAVSP